MRGLEYNKLYKQWAKLKAENAELRRQLATAKGHQQHSDALFSLAKRCGMGDYDSQPPEMFIEQKLAREKGITEGLILEIKEKNYPCGDALNRLWSEIILANKPKYGDWEYPGQAYRHIMAEVKQQLATARKDTLAEVVKHIEAEELRWFFAPCYDTPHHVITEVVLSVNRLAAQPPAEQPCETRWRPMDTAPKDGTEILLQVERRAGAGGKMLVGHWMPGGYCIEDHPAIDAGWYFWDGCRFDKASKPICWTPCPACQPEKEQHND